MGVISIALSHLVKAGVSGDDLVTAIAEIEAEIQSFNTSSVAKRRASDAERQQKVRDKRKSHVTSRDECDAPNKVSPQTPFPINPENPPIVPPSEVDQAVEIWNGAAERRGLAKSVKITRRRQAAIRARLDEFGLDGWRKAVGQIESSPFHCGKNDRGWKADIDFVATESKFLTLIERPAAQPRASPEMVSPC